MYWLIVPVYCHLFWSLLLLLSYLKCQFLGKLSGKYSEDFEDVLADSESNSDMENNSMSGEDEVS